MKFWIVLIITLFAGGAAAETLNYNQISLSVDSRQQVRNDLLIVVVFTQHQGEDPAKLSGLVNQDMDWALDVVAKAPQIESQTLSYTSNPVYNKSRITGWRVRQELKLTSADHTALGSTIGNLQSRMAVQSIAYQVSDQARKQAEDQLIVEALQNFQTRARLVAKQMGRDDYRVVNINIVTQGSVQPRPYMRSAMARAEADAPRLEAGTQEVVVKVNGTIELSLK